MQDLLRFDFATCDCPFTDDIIHAFIGGSELHGGKIDGTDDHDIYGVFIERPENVLGLDPIPHFVWSSSTTERRNGPDDVDVVLYGLKKWASLACSGNPTVLHFLFAPNLVSPPSQCALWVKIVENRQLFLARSHHKKYVGYAIAQLKKMAGGRSLNVHRPELVEAHGYDTKFAMHTIRILIECEELLSTGYVTLPCKEKDLLIAIRKGEVPQEWLISETERRIEVCKRLAETADVLAAEIDQNAVSQLIAQIYREHWEA